jgi:hypothetical protein
MRSTLPNAAFVVSLGTFIFVSFVMCLTSDARLGNALAEIVPAAGLVVSFGLVLLLPFTSLGRWLNRQPSLSFAIFCYLFFGLTILLTFGILWNLYLVLMLAGSIRYHRPAAVLGAFFAFGEVVVLTMWLAAALTTAWLSADAAWKVGNRIRKRSSSNEENKISLLGLRRWWIFLVLVSLVAWPVSKIAFAR